VFIVYLSIRIRHFERSQNHYATYPTQAEPWRLERTLLGGLPQYFMNGYRVRNDRLSLRCRYSCIHESIPYAEPTTNAFTALCEPSSCKPTTPIVPKLGPEELALDSLANSGGQKTNTSAMYLKESLLSIPNCQSAAMLGYTSTDRCDIDIFVPRMYCEMHESSSWPSAWLFHVLPTCDSLQQGANTLVAHHPVFSSIAI